MKLKDLRTLQIGLELYRLEEPLDGQCEDLIEFLLRLVRADTLRMEERREARAESRKQKEGLQEAEVAQK